MPFSQHRRTHTLFMMVFFSCLGITTEVFFTAFMALVKQQPLNGKPLVAMAGTSYVWMAAVYALIPLLGFLFYNKVKHLPIYLRLPLYVGLIYAVEFTSGYLLQVTTGYCPWQYTEGWHLMGLVRIDYFPAWLLFTYIVERLYVFVNNKVIQ